MNHKKIKLGIGFTLVETIVVLMLASLILVAVLGVYGRMRANAVTILDRLQQNRLQAEILQKIAEDIDKLAAPGFEATINFQNKLDNGYRSAKLTLLNSYYGNNNKKETYEQIEWLSSYDVQYDALKLYRMHGGLNVADKVLGANSDDEPLYIPVAGGITHFELKAQQGENILGAWTSETLPKAVRIGISFAPLQELDDGSVGVPEEEISFRTVAIDRTRLIPYQFIKKSFELPDEEDPNELPDDRDPNAILDDPDGLAETEADNELESDKK